MTMAAVVSTYAFGLVYFAATGVYFFYDSYIPIAVFLGMHLLFTDPSTAPRTELGRLLFGVLYGLSTVALYVLLDRAGAPTFYDKLLQVPLLNLSVIAIDRAVGGIVPAAPRPCRPRPRAGAPAAPPGLHGRLGRRVRRDERRGRRRRPPPRPVAAVLAAGLRRRPAARLPLPGRPAVRPLQQRLRLGVQRGGHPAGGALDVCQLREGRRDRGQSSGSRRRTGRSVGSRRACRSRGRRGRRGRAGVRARLRAGVRAGVRRTSARWRKRCPPRSSARRRGSTTTRSSCGAARGRSPTASPRRSTRGPAARDGRVRASRSARLRDLEPPADSFFQAPRRGLGWCSEADSQQGSDGRVLIQDQRPRCLN